MAYIEVKNLFKSYNENRVLKDLSFDIEKGEIFGLIGPNGAGKTTLIDIMTGLSKADSGEVFIDGLSIKKDIVKIKSKLGVVPQDLALMENISARDNLIYFGSLYGLSGKLLKERVEEALVLTGLSDRSKEKVKNFSGGMKRRLNIAAAILHKPEILILDEPTVGVDPQSRNFVFDFLKKMNQEGTTILYISHYMEEIEILCNQILLMDLGVEVASGSKNQIKSMVSHNSKVNVLFDRLPNELIDNINVKVNGVINAEIKDKELILTISNNDFSMMRLIQEIEKTDSIIKSISVDEITLEETFIQLTGKSLRD